MSFEGKTDEISMQLKEAASGEEPVLKRKKTEIKPRNKSNSILTLPQNVLDSEVLTAFREIYPDKMYTNDDPKKSVRYLAKTKFTVVLSFKPIIEDMW